MNIPGFFENEAGNDLKCAFGAKFFLPSLLLTIETLIEFVLVLMEAVIVPCGSLLVICGLLLVACYVEWILRTNSGWD